MIDHIGRAKLAAHKQAKGMTKGLDTIADEIKKMPKETDNSVEIAKLTLQRLDFQSYLLLNIYKELKKLNNKKK